MRKRNYTFTVQELVDKINLIEFPEYQREPTVWKLTKKQRLIDSILRDFDIAPIYLFRKNDGTFDCIDGGQRINAILSFLGMNEETDEEDNGFRLKINNEIFDDKSKFSEVDNKTFSSLSPRWKKVIQDYKINIIEIDEVENEEELNLLFLRLQLGSVLNAGEKLHAMTGDMRDSIFDDIGKHSFFKQITIPYRRYAREQVAAQIVLNFFSKKEKQEFRRSRYLDLQDFFKQKSKFSSEDKRLIGETKQILDKIEKSFKDKLKLINNRAIAVSVFLFISELTEQGKEDEINQFIHFFEKFIKTLKWQIPKGVEMDRAYYDLLKFQTNITQAAGEKSSIQKRYDFLNEYFEYFKKYEGIIKGDKEFKKETSLDPNTERDKN